MIREAEEEVELAKKHLKLAQEKVENAYLLEKENKNQQYITKVKNNETKLIEIKQKLGLNNSIFTNISNIDDIHKLSIFLKELKKILKICTECDYYYDDGDGYGSRWISRGPKEGHSINTEVFVETTDLIKKTDEHLTDLLINFEWVKKFPSV